MADLAYVIRGASAMHARPMPPVPALGHSLASHPARHSITEVSHPMFRSFARTRAFPVLAWSYVVALGIQVFFAGLYVFAGASNIELHRNMAHVIGALSALLVVATFVGRVPEKRLVFGVLGLLVLQGMLVHVHQWFDGFAMVAALHPVNALVLTYAALTLAKRSRAYWTSDTPAAVEPAVADRPLTAELVAG